MNRREVIVAFACGLAAQAGGVWAQTDPLETAFSELPDQARRNVQVELQMAGLYAGTVDGAFGKGTRAALIAAAKVISASGKWGSPDVNSLSGARAYLKRMSMGEYMNPLYDSGFEG